MSLFFRALWVYILSFFRPRIIDITAPSTVDFRVLPNDLDTNIHMNNGRYLTIMDLGRFDLVLRSGILRYMMKQKSIPVLASAQMRWRISLQPFQKYTLETRVICWDEKWVFLEQRFIIGGGKKNGAVAAIGLVKGSFYNNEKQRTVPTAELLEILNIPHISPPMPAHVQEWIEAEEALREVTS